MQITHHGIRAEGAGAAALLYPQASQHQKGVAVVSSGNIDEAAFQVALGSLDLCGPSYQAVCSPTQDRR